jgi:hypothetical protein
MSETEFQLYTASADNLMRMHSYINTGTDNFDAKKAEIAYKKQIAIQYLSQQMTLDNLMVNDDPTVDVPGKLKDYSATGKYDVGSELSSDDAAKMFLYNYDKTFGVDLSDYGINTNDIKPTIGDYDINDIGLNDKQSFDTYNVAGDTANGVFKQNDILPGFKAHFKIIDKDVDSDAQKCTLKFLVGISYDNDPTDQIL